MNRRMKFLIISVVLLIISIIYTILVKYVDVAAIGPNGSRVGFAALNKAVHELVGVNMIWYHITKYAGVLPILLALYYAYLGLRELVSKKDFSKIDKKMIALGVFYVVFALVYVLFEKIALNYRPTLIDGELEASYPSSHTLLALCICGSSLLISKYFIKNNKFRKILDICTWVVMFLIVIGRIISGVHWASDIIGGVIISGCLLSCFYTSILVINRKVKR